MALKIILIITTEAFRNLLSIRLSIQSEVLAAALSGTLPSILNFISANSLREALPEFLSQLPL